MRIAIIALASAAVALAQDGPSKTAPEERLAHQFSFEQGWVTREELIAGLGEPVFNDLRMMDSTGIPGLNRPFDPFMRPEPLKGDGRLVKEKDGLKLELDRLEYWDLSQRWWVTFNGATIEARNIVKDRWKGNAEEWAKRLDDIEKVVLAHYAKCGAPTGKKQTSETLGFRVEDDPAKRLFVLAAVEEQLMGLLVLRLNGSTVEKGWAPDVLKRYPDRVVNSTRQLIARLVAQAKGDLAPAAVKSKKARGVQKAEWTYDNPAVPTFPWTLETKWAKARDQQIVAARKRIADVIDGSKSTAIERAAWNAMLDKEVEALNGVNGSVPDVVANAGARDVLEPRMFWAGKATFDYDEKLSMKDGVVVTSKVEVLGHVKGQLTAFYDCVTHQWRLGELVYDTWFRSTVTKTK